MLLRTATKFQPHVARQRKAKRGVQGFVAVSHAIYLLETLVSSGIANIDPNPAPRS
ncbi:hypothetical protein [Pilibacter termitis]|uniref:hypothetical protein n=1 Tax=Pilibacter termitis TaxID=263852 RepID=UPI00135650EA|nr:hypothetical protein [Pilibacter termitis]